MPIFVQLMFSLRVKLNKIGATLAFVDQIPAWGLRTISYGE